MNIRYELRKVSFISNMKQGKWFVDRIVDGMCTGEKESPKFKTKRQANQYIISKMDEGDPR